MDRACRTDRRCARRPGPAARKTALATADTMSLPVIVIGAGIGGLAAAVALAARGERVVVLEHGRLLADGPTQKLLQA